MTWCSMFIWKVIFFFQRRLRWRGRCFSRNNWCANVSWLLSGCWFLRVHRVTSMSIVTEYGFQLWWAPYSVTMDMEVTRWTRSGIWTGVKISLAFLIAVGIISLLFQLPLQLLLIVRDYNFCRSRGYRRGSLRASCVLHAGINPIKAVCHSAWHLCVV